LHGTRRDALRLYISRAGIAPGADLKSRVYDKETAVLACRFRDAY
jgi:hypothetical protein